MGTKIISPAGVNVDAESDTALFTLGAEARGQDGSVWVYGQAGAALSKGNVVSFTTAWSAAKLTKALADTGAPVGVAQRDFTSAYYGWFLRKGCNSTTYKVMVKNGCLPGVGLYTTGSAGALDDTSASQTLVYGIQITQTSTSSLSVRAACLAIEIWPPSAP